MILLFSILYGVVRFSVEFLRDDPRGDILGLTTLTGLSTSQMISLLIGLGALIIFIRRWRRADAILSPQKVSPSTTKAARV